jgi:quercetin dioxygenase-like cupin family protein
MSDYTKVNFQDYEQDEDKAVEAIFTRKYLNSSDLGVSLFKYKPGHRSESAHSHKVQEEVYVVVKGSGKMLLNDDVIYLRQWDVIRVAPEVVRAFEAGEDGLSLVIAGGPKPKDGDGVKAEANWPK